MPMLTLILHLAAKEEVILMGKWFVWCCRGGIDIVYNS